MNVAADRLPAPREHLGSRLAALIRPQRRMLAVIAGFVLAGALFELVPPVVIRWAAAASSSKSNGLRRRIAFAPSACTRFGICSSVSAVIRVVVPELSA